MRITEDGKKALEVLMHEELKRVNASDDGKLKSFGELEDTVSSIILKLGESLLQELATAQEPKSAPQKKTARVVARSGNS